MNNYKRNALPNDTDELTNFFKTVRAHNAKSATKHKRHARYVAQQTDGQRQATLTKATTNVFLAFGMGNK